MLISFIWVMSNSSGFLACISSSKWPVFLDQFLRVLILSWAKSKRGWLRLWQILSQFSIHASFDIVKLLFKMLHRNIFILICGEKGVKKNADTIKSPKNDKWTSQ